MFKFHEHLLNTYTKKYKIPGFVKAEWLSIIFEKPWHSGEVTSDWKKRNIVPIFKNSREGHLEQLTNQAHLCIQWYHGTDHPSRHVKTYERHMEDSQDHSW